MMILFALFAFTIPAEARNCPPNINHCQFVIPIGTTATATVEWGVSATLHTGQSGLYAVLPGASASIWARVAIDSNSTDPDANITLQVNATTPGIEWLDTTSVTVLATTTPQNVTFPFTLDLESTPGDIVFVPARVVHVDEEQTAETHVPFEVAAVQEATLPPMGRVMALPLALSLIGIAALVGTIVGALARGGFGGLKKD